MGGFNVWDGLKVVCNLQVVELVTKQGKGCYEVDGSVGRVEIGRASENEKRKEEVEAGVRGS